jgi:hypothetical protein
MILICDICRSIIDQSLNLGHTDPRPGILSVRDRVSVQMSYQQVIADHRLIQVGLERTVSTLVQSIVAEVALQAFDHAFRGGTTRHNGLESLGHGRIAGVDMFQGIERDGDGSPRCGVAIAALRPAPASHAHRKPIVLLRCAIDERCAGVANTLVVHLMASQADGHAIGGDEVDPENWTG